MSATQDEMVRITDRLSGRPEREQRELLECYFSNDLIDREQYEEIESKLPL